jgi:hypothetical protein
MRPRVITLRCHPKISHIHLVSSSKAKHNVGKPTPVKRIGLQNLMNDARCNVFKSSHEIDTVPNEVLAIPCEFYKIRLANIVCNKNVLKSLNLIPTR